MCNVILPTFRDNLSSLTFEDGTDSFPETSVTNYHSTLVTSQKSEYLIYTAA